MSEHKTVTARPPAKPTGRKYNSVRELVREEIASREVRRKIGKPDATTPILERIAELQKALTKARWLVYQLPLTRYKRVRMGEAYRQSAIASLNEAIRELILLKDMYEPDEDDQG